MNMYIIADWSVRCM